MQPLLVSPWQPTEISIFGGKNVVASVTLVCGFREAYLRIARCVDGLAVASRTRNPSRVDAFYASSLINPFTRHGLRNRYPRNQWG